MLTKTTIGMEKILPLAEHMKHLLESGLSELNAASFHADSAKR